MDAPEKQSALWNDSLEALIKSLGEKALSLSWLHNRAEKRYSYLNNYLAIPAIVVSTITGVGTASWGTEPGINFLMAGLSIFVSIISTLNSYFAFAKRAEAHRLTAVSYSKLYLQISIELSLPRKKRMSVKEFLKNVSEQVQRLNEISPIIPDIVITDYNVKFKDEPLTISRPEITNGLVDIKIYRDLIDDIPTVPQNGPDPNFTVTIPTEIPTTPTAPAPAAAAPDIKPPRASSIPKWKP
jgi:hypothetical protein